jgi:hypothetical protein
MEIYMKGNGLMVKRMEKDTFCMLMVKNILDFGQMIHIMGKEGKFGLIILIMMEILKMGKGMVMELLYGLMDLFIWGSLKIIKLMEKVFFFFNFYYFYFFFLKKKELISGLMVDFLMGNGKMVKFVEKERIFMKMDKFMKDNIWMMLKKGLVFLCLVKIKNMLENGKMISLMEMELLLKMGLKKKGFGNMENIFNGFDFIYFFFYFFFFMFN